MVKEAILAGIQNDMGSGSQVDLCVITTTTADTKTGDTDTEYLRVVSNYTRAVVPEQQLAPIEQQQQKPEGVEKKMAAATTSPTTTSSTPGVNGFGNHPYSVRSKRLILSNRINEENDKLQTWEEALGLTATVKQ